MKIRTLFKLGFLVALACGALEIYEYYKTPDLTVVGVVKMSDGIGRQGVELVDALRSKLRISFEHTLKPCYKDVTKKLKRILKKQRKSSGKVVLFEDCVWTPERDNSAFLNPTKKEDQIRIAYSMFESSSIPHQWTEIFNEKFDAVVVPDKYHVKVYKSSGVNIPIFVVPLGLNLDAFLNSPIKKRAQKHFTFGNFSAIIDRKNTMKLVTAFHKAFQNRQDVALRLNARYTDEAIERAITDYIENNQIQNIVLTKKCLSSSEYLKLFHSIDCYVSPSKGEGYSIQPREAMALGIPVILSDATAQKTLCSTDGVRQIHASIEKPALRRWGTILKTPVQYGFEYDISEEDLQNAMLEVYTNYTDFVSKAETLRSIAKTYSFQNLLSYYEQLIKPKKIVYGPDNQIEKNCLVTADRRLFNKYKKVLKTPS